MNPSKKLYCLGFILSLTTLVSTASSEEVLTTPELAEVQDAFAPVVGTSELTPNSPVIAFEPKEIGLEAISIGPQKSIAVISGELYELGEEKNGVEVVQIRRKDVDIMMNGLVQTIPLYGEDPTAIVTLASEKGKKKKSPDVIASEAKQSPEIASDATHPRNDEGKDEIQSMKELLKDL